MDKTIFSRDYAEGMTLLRFQASVDLDTHGSDVAHLLKTAGKSRSFNPSHKSVRGVLSHMTVTIEKVESNQRPVLLGYQEARETLARVLNNKMAHQDCTLLERLWADAPTVSTAGIEHARLLLTKAFVDGVRVGQFADSMGVQNNISENDMPAVAHLHGEDDESLNSLDMVDFQPVKKSWKFWLLIAVTFPVSLPIYAIYWVIKHFKETRPKVNPQVGFAPTGSQLVIAEPTETPRQGFPVGARFYANRPSTEINDMEALERKRQLAEK